MHPKEQSSIALAPFNDVDTCRSRATGDLFHLGICREYDVIRIKRGALLGTPLQAGETVIGGSGNLKDAFAWIGCDEVGGRITGEDTGFERDMRGRTYVDYVAHAALDWKEA